MNMKPLFVSIGLSFSLCVACGGSDGGSPSAGGAPNTSSGNFSTGLPGDKQLGSLTDAESAALCQKLSAYFAEGSAVAKGVEEFTCRFSSAFTALLTAPQTDAALQASCKSLYDTCVASPTTTTETCSKPDATCTATAAEYDACVNDEINALSQLEKAIPSCDKITLASAGSLLTGASLQPTATCQTLQAKCPSAPTPPGFDDFSSAP